MKFVLNGKDYALDELTMTFAEGEKIENLTGLSYASAGAAMREGSLRPIRALMLVAINRVDPDVSFQDLETAQIEKLEFAWDEVAEKKELPSES